MIVITYLAPETWINTYTTNDQNDVAVTALTGGGQVVGVAPGHFA